MHRVLSRFLKNRTSSAHCQQRILSLRNSFLHLGLTDIPRFCDVRNTASESAIETEPEQRLTQQEQQQNRNASFIDAEFRQIITKRFHQEPKSASHELLTLLNHQQRSDLHKELEQLIFQQKQKVKTEEEIFLLADKRHPSGLLDREEFLNALKEIRLQEKLEKQRKKRLPVSNSELVSLAIVTSVPYVGFGFLDNFIMIMAGESIEHTFGLTLGLSMMAAAALGNTVSDVAGVCMQKTVEEQGKKLPFFSPPTFSRFQQSTVSVRMAKTVGAIIGVVIGCVLGMIPLLWFDAHPENGEKSKGQKQSTSSSS